MDAPDQEKAPIIRDNLETMKEESLSCIDDVEYPASRVADHVADHYRWFEEGFDDWSVAIVIQLALHRMGLMHAAREYRYTLQDITDYCFDTYYGKGDALNICLARQLISRFRSSWKYENHVNTNSA